MKLTRKKSGEYALTGDRDEIANLLMGAMRTANHFLRDETDPEKSAPLTAFRSAVLDMQEEMVTFEENTNDE